MALDCQVRCTEIFRRDWILAYPRRWGRS